MQAPSRGLTLDQLRAPVSSSNGAGDTAQAQAQSPLALTPTELAHHPLALLEGMLRSLSPTESRDIIAHRLATLARQAAGIDLCVVMLTDPAPVGAQFIAPTAAAPTAAAPTTAPGTATLVTHSATPDTLTAAPGAARFSIRASSPDISAHILAIPPMLIEAELWEKLSRPTTPGQLPALDIHDQESLNPLNNVTYGSLFILPLSAGTECTGLLYGYTSSVRDLAPQELLTLQTLCSYAAMSITSRALLDLSHTGSPVQTFFDNLLASTPSGEANLRQQAATLGYDVTQPSAMAVLELIESPDDPFLSPVRAGVEERRGGGARAALASDTPNSLMPRLLSYIHARIQEQYPRSLINERGQRLYCIVALEGDIDAARLDTWLTDLARQIEGDYGERLCAGLSQPCKDIRDYARGFAEAHEALQIGERLGKHAASARFNALSPYRYLYPFARAQRLSDRHLEHVKIIAAYDRKHKRGNLLHSLATYLTMGGNIKNASEQLKVHRNTLTQRLERIHEICGVDLDNHQECFALQMAIMIYRLQA